MKYFLSILILALVWVLPVLGALPDPGAGEPVEWTYSCNGCPATNPPNHCGTNWVYEYDFTCTYTITRQGGQCTVTHMSKLCDATDTCDPVGAPGLKAGLCLGEGGCGIGGQYKVCCNPDATNGSCVGGVHSGVCGGGSSPIIGSTCTGKLPAVGNDTPGQGDWCTQPFYWTYFSCCLNQSFDATCGGGSPSAGCQCGNTCSERHCDGAFCVRRCSNDRNCPFDGKTGLANPSYQPYTYDSNCSAPPGDACPKPEKTVRDIPPPTCGPYDHVVSDPCADLSLPLDSPPNQIITHECKECVFETSDFCGAQRSCGGRLPSCGDVTLTGAVWEHTGTGPAPALEKYIHEPLQNFKSLTIQVVSSDHPATCTTTGGTYSCVVRLANDTRRHGKLKLLISALGYVPTQHELAYAAGNDPSTKTEDIYVDYIATNNTSPGNWTQVRGASYAPRGSGSTTKTIMNVMPIAPTRYDTNDAVPTLTNYAYNTGTDAYGAVTSNAFLGNYTKYSVDRDWHIDGYPMANRDVTSVYLQYVTKRKLTAYVANSYPRGSVILVPGGTIIPTITDLSFTGAVADGGVLFLVGTSGAPGAVTLSGNITTTTTVGIIAGGITVSPAVSEIDGVFAANTFDTGATTDQGLKIVGNLSVVSSFTNNRKWRDTSRPSVYVQYDIGRQLGLLKNLSIATSTSQQEE